MRAAVHRIVVIVILAGTAVAGRFASAQTPPVHSQASDQGSQLEQWARQLGDDNYHVREHAAARLRRADIDAVDPIARSMASADMEIVERGSRILTEVAMSHAPDHDGGAWETLSRMADRGIGLAAARSHLAVDEIRKHRASIALNKIVSASAILSNSDLIIQSSKRPNQVVLLIDERFKGDDEVLSWLRWLDGVRNVCLVGTAVSSPVLDEVVQMRDLQALVLADGQANRGEIEPLLSADQLQYLELQYTSIASPAAELLPGLPVRMGLSLNGTGVTEDQVAAIRAAAPGLAIEYKQGGFLGVMSSAFSDDCLIASVVAGSSADEAGLQSGDIITSVNDIAISNFDDLRLEIAKHAPGEDLEVQFLRDGEALKTVLNLGRQKSSVTTDPFR